MKLSFKIFWGICIPSIISILIVSIILITRSFENNMQNEETRCIQEFRIIEMNIVNSINNSTADEKNIISAYSDYYKDKEIDFMYYENGQILYTSGSDMELENKQLLTVSDNNVLTTIQEIQGQKHILVSTKIANNKVIIYVKNVNEIYKLRENLIRLSIILIVMILLCIAIIAYLIAKSITRPLIKMQKEMVKISKGNYNINLKEGKNEVGILAKSFNQMSKEIQHRDNELNEMVNSKQLFIDNLSHEINTPLTSILGYAELLEKVNCTEEQKNKFLLNIQEEAKMINDMHKKLLLLSYKKNSDLNKKYNNINKIFDEVQRSINFKLKEQNINLIINNSLDNIYGDETLIVMCIINLISNAIHASKAESKIEVNAFEKDGKSYICVVDEGNGISKENIEKIIEPFYRVDKARSRKNGGAGLGLSICNSIMQLHNGKIKIESEIGKGSNFILEFPKN